MGEGCCHGCGTKEGRLLIHDHFDRDRTHEACIAAFVLESFHECSISQFGQSLRCDAAAQIHTVECHGLQSEVPRFSSIDRGKEVECLCGDICLPLKPGFC